MSVNWSIPSCLLESYQASICPDRFAAEQTVLDSAALDSYIYGYPLVLVDVTRNIMLYGGLRLNHFLHERSFPNPQYTTIVRPNVDTLYSMAWLDLRWEPMVLEVPATVQRYYLMELLDAWTNVFASLGTRTTGAGEGCFAITGPGWNGKLPEGIVRVESPTNSVWIIGRTQTNGPRDYPAVHAIQDQYRLFPLSRWGKQESQSADHGGKRPINLNPAAVVANMDAASFFATMTSAMLQNPPWIEDPEMNRKLAVLGLTSAASLDSIDRNPSVAFALEMAVHAGPRVLKEESARNYARNHARGWLLGLQGMGFYGADYLQRAMVALTGIGANLPPDAVYGVTFLDALGMPLAGFRNYRLHFNQDQLPPVNAFWSLTLYNDQGYLVKNQMNRYAISPHLDDLKYNGDGSLDIFIGSGAPEKNGVANWLPAPQGSFNLVLRMYWPESRILKGQWHAPGVIRV